MSDRPTPTLESTPVSQLVSRAPSRTATGFQRTASTLRTVLPHLLRLLPLLDGNIGSAVSNLLVPPAPVPPPPPPVNLEPIENGLAELKTEQLNLGEQLAEQNASLQRIESRLETIEEAAAHKALSHQELLGGLKSLGSRVEELKASGRKAKVVSQVVLGLLGLSVLLNLVLLLQALRLLR